jgi:glucose/mannose-6-phosphate isomerase
LSYSGNSQEALSAYCQAREKGAEIIAVTAGGRLKEYAAKDKVTLLEVPANLPPRYAIGYLGIMPLCLMARLGIIGDIHAALKECRRLLELLRDKSLSWRVPERENPAKYIARKIHNKFVVIYSGSSQFEVVAARLRSQLSENSKVLASSFSFPEIIHNEVMGWNNPRRLLKNFAVIMLRDSKMDARVIRAMELVKGMLKKDAVEVYELCSKGEGLLSRILSLVYAGDYLSFYLAMLYGVDPAPTERIDYLKKELKGNAALKK